MESLRDQSERLRAERNARIEASRLKKQANHKEQRDRGLNPMDLAPGKHPVFDHPDFEASQLCDTCDDDEADDD